MIYEQNEFVVPYCYKVLGDMLIKIADQNRNNKLNEEINAKNEGIKQMESLVNDDLLDEEIKND